MSSPAEKVDTSSGSGFLSGVYSGSVSLGEFKATIGLIAALAIGVLVVLFGFYFIFYDDDGRYIQVTGKVMKSECIPITTYDRDNRPITSYKCNVTVGYKINNKDYSHSIFTKTSSSYLVNEPIQLWVDSTDYSDVQLANIRSSHIGSSLLCCAIVVVALAYLNYYMTHRFEIYASAQGASTVVDVFK